MKRSDAMAAGLVRYQNGKPCPRGHLGDRFVSTGQCAECLVGRAKKWRDQNPDKVKAYTQEYRQGREKLLSEKCKKWRKSNIDIARKLCEDWHSRNPECKRIYQAKRRARKFGSIGDFTRFEIRELMIEQNSQCVYCKTNIADLYNIDHIQPLALGGSNHIENIQLLCPSCNQSKHLKSHSEFVQQLEGNRK